MKDTDFLFLAAMLGAKESKMLSWENILQIPDSLSFDDTVKTLMDYGYPDMSGMSAQAIEVALTELYRTHMEELSLNIKARHIIELFRLKYDYHNIKTLVKSGTQIADDNESSRILSGLGCIDAKSITNAFISGNHYGLPPDVSKTMTKAAKILHRTDDPRLADIYIDKAYFSELLSKARSFRDTFITGYVRLLIDIANLRIFVRSKRTGYKPGFIGMALIPGGNVDNTMILHKLTAEASAANIFTHVVLESAARLGTQALSGGGLSQFEAACDNAVRFYVSGKPPFGFGPECIVAYLTALDREIAAVRLLLTGKLHGLPHEVILDRLRELYAPQCLGLSALYTD